MVTLKTTEIRYALANDSERLYEFLDTLTMKHDFVSVTSIGKTAEGRMIPVVTLGTGEKGNIYVGGMRAVDLISPSVLRLCGVLFGGQENVRDKYAVPLGASHNTRHSHAESRRVYDTQKRRGQMHHVRQAEKPQRARRS